MQQLLLIHLQKFSFEISKVQAIKILIYYALFGLRKPAR